MRHTLVWSSCAVLSLGVVGLTACGDDGGTGGMDTETGGTTLTTSTTSTSEPTTSIGSTSVDTMDATSDGTGTSTTQGTGTESGTDGTSSGGPNTDPEAFDDLYLTNTQEAMLSVDALSGVLANDMDADGDTLSIDSADAMSSAGGTVVVNADGSFDYTPAPGFFGDDRFGYVASDGNGGTSAAEVRIMVAPTLEGGNANALIDGEGAGDDSGWAIGGGFDIDGNGGEDLVIGAIEADGPSTVEGKAYALFAPSGSVSLTTIAGGTGGFEMVGRSTNGQSGHSVALLGDVNGDGLSDIAVGAPTEGTGGEAYVVFGKADGTDVVLEDVAGGTGGFVIDGATAGDQLGYSVGAAGDFNGDGLADIIVGAPQDDPDEGYAVIVYGKAGTASVAVGDLGSGSGLGLALTGVGSFDQAGYAVAGAGDTNRDGLDDVVVSANFADPNGGTSGRIYVVFGTGSDADIALSTVASGTGGYPIDGEAALDLAGEAVAGAGDVNGDGRADVIVGAIGHDPGAGDQAGRAYVVFGKDDTNTVSLTTVAGGTGGFAMTGEGQNHFAGAAVAGAGDVDGDGFADVVVGAWNYSTSQGRAYLVYGGTSTAEVDLSEIALGNGGFALQGEGSSDAMGWSVGGAGDVNGDGYDDILAGAYRDDDAGNGAGRSYILYGGDYGGLTSGEATSGDDTLTGAMSNDYIVGGLGADMILGEGGNDVLYGGPGDDVIVIPTGGDFFRLDGGTGDDTLQLSGTGTTLDLTAYTELVITGFETLDITGAGNNALVMELRDLRALSPTSNTVTVVGDAGDTLSADLQSAGFVDMGSAGGFTTYGNGVLSLVVADAITSNVQI